MNKKLFTSFCLGIFLSIVGIFFYPTLVQGKLPVPSDSLVGLYHPWHDVYAKNYPRGIPFKNFLITDPVRQQIPWRKIAIDQWKEGKIPRWNPYAFSGAPLAANVQAAVFYPLNILFFLFDFPFAWTIFIILEPLLAGVLLFIYLRHLRLDPLACLLGALAWSFSGFSIAWLTWGTMVHVALWLPLTLLSVDKLFRGRKKIIWSVVIVLSLIMQLFAGHAQIALYGMGVGLVYGVWRFLLDRRAAIKMLPWFVSGLLVFLVLASVQWIPFLRFIIESGRIGEVDSWVKEGWFIPWQHLVQFLAPDFFGNPTTLNYWGVWNYGEFIGYIGVIPLVFALVHVFSKKTKDAIFWIGVAVAALLFALPTPLSKLPYLLQFPILSSLQPTRLMVVIDFALVMLAAFGFDGWLQKKESRSRVPMLMMGALFVVLWIIVTANGGENFQVSRRNLVLPTIFYITSIALLSISKQVKQVALFRNIVTWGLVGITAFDLLRFGWKFTPFTPREYFFPQTAIIEFLQKQEKPFRVMSTDKRILPPNVSAYFGIETIEGYDPLISGRYEELMAAIARGKPNITPPFGFNRIVTLESVDSSLLPMLNVRYILTLSDVERPFVRKVFQEGETRVYEYLAGLPKVFFVSDVRNVSNKQEAIRELFDASFHPTSAAIVEGMPEAERDLKNFTNGTVRVISYTSGSIVLETELSDEGYLVVAESYTSNWKVKIDGISKPIFLTNYNFLGVLVSAGTHRIEFSL